MAKVQLLVYTFYKKPLKPGDIIEVDASVAERWEKNGIAKWVEGEQIKAPKDPDEKIAVITLAELKEIAETNGVDVSGLKTKADIVKALQAAGVEV